MGLDIHIHTHTHIYTHIQVHVLELSKDVIQNQGLWAYMIHGSGYTHTYAHTYIHTHTGACARAQQRCHTKPKLMGLYDTWIWMGVTLCASGMDLTRHAL